VKILVTGATGFVGSQLVKYLASQGKYAIRVLARKTSRLDDLKNLNNVEICYGDVNDFDSLKRAIDGIEAVIHLVSLIGESGKREDFFRVNVEGTRNLLEVCKDLKLKRFVHISSLSVITGYKDHDGTKEDAPYLPTGENYADSKIEGEKLVLDYGRKYELPITILRAGFIYGPGDRLFLPTVIQNLKEGKVILIDQGKKLLNLTYVDNLIEAIELSLEKEKAIGEIFNITDGEKISKKQFFFKVSNLMKISPPTKSIPFFAAKALCEIISFLFKVLRIKKAPPISRMKLRFAGQNQWFNIYKSESILGYSHKIKFDEGIEKAVKWYCTQ
jgi:nucleoside-diphosphate-sugar epimerase